MGNFVDQSWAMDNMLDLQKVKKEVNIRTFNGTLARGGRVTQKTCGVSVKIGSKALATTFRVLKKSQYPVILAMTWFDGIQSLCGLEE